MASDDDKDLDMMGTGSKDPGGELEIDAEMDAGADHNLAYKRTSDLEDELDRLAEGEGGDEPVDEDAIDLDGLQVPQKSSGGIGKIVAPLLVLVVAAGAAGFIVMHPEIISSKSAAPAVIAAATPAGQQNGAITLAQSDISENPPQPSSTHNDAGPTVPPPPVPDISAPTVNNGSAAPPSADAAAPAPPTPPTPMTAAEEAKGGDTKPAGAAPADTSKAADSKDAKAADAAVKSADPSAPESPVKMAAPETPAAPPALSASDATDGNSASKDATTKAPEVVADTHAPQPDASKLKPLVEPPPVSGQPSPDALTPPPISPTQGAQTGTASSPTVPVTHDKKAEKASDSYYDADEGVPSKTMAVAAGPRKVNPNIEPAQKFVVVSGVRKETDAESVMVSAERALSLGRYDAALDIYNSLYTKNKRDSRVLMGRAVAQQNLGMDDAAIDTYKELLSVAPDNPDAMVNMLGLVKKKEPAVALQRMLDLQKQFPAHAGLAAQIGITEGETGHYPEAIKYLGMAASMEPANPQHPFNMAVLADRQGDTPNAIKFYEQALQVASTAAAGLQQSFPRDSIYDRLAVLRRQ